MSLTTERTRRRRILVTLTATLTAVTMVVGLALIGLSASPTAASAAPDLPWPSAVPAALANSAPLTPTQPASPSATPSATAEPTTGPSLDDVENVVLVLVDDLDWNLFRQVPRLAALQQRGLTFTNTTVADSLCCPSRASILTSRYIHNHGVVSNLDRTGGGWPTFRDNGWHTDCLPVWLDNAGVTTALVGKYLNDYPNTPRGATYVPPGWDEWVVPVSRGDSYTGYDYDLNVNGKVLRYGKKPTDFLNDVLTTKATDFIRTAQEPFFLELATYSPHNPSPVAVRHKGTHFATVAPRTPNYNQFGTNEPTWLRKMPPIKPWKQARLDQEWRKRAQSTEAVADSVEQVLATLEETGHTDDTLVIVTSDNGYHIGSHRLFKGKRTAFREDTVVPMVVIGPGVTPNRTVGAMTATIDLGPTIGEILGADVPTSVDGRSLAGIIRTGQAPDAWRTATISESLGTSGPGDPDYQPQAPPQFTSLRTQDYLFVVYRSGERELYDLRADPYEMNNIAATADTRLVADLYSQLQALRSCSGESCRTADALVAQTSS